MSCIALRILLTLDHVPCGMGVKCAAAYADYFFMKDVLRFGKKLFTTSVVVMTIAWSMGLAALVPAGVAAAEACPVFKAGLDYKVKAGSGTLFRYDGTQLRPWFHERDWRSWDGSETNVVQTTSECLGTLKIGPSMSFRAGSFAVKVPDLPKIYIPGPNDCWSPVASAEVLKAIMGGEKAFAGEKAGGYLRDVSATLASGYKICPNMAEVTEAKLLPGQLVKTADSPTPWWVDPATGKLHEVKGDISSYLKKTLVTVAADVVAKTVKDTTTRTPAAVVEMGGTVTPPAEGTGALQISLAADTPAAGLYIGKGAYNAEFTKLTFKATGGKVRVDKIVIKRDGLGFDADISTVRLYDGSKQIGSDQALDTNKHLATFSNINWDIAAGETKTLTVKADTVAGLSGTNDVMTLSTVELEGAGTVAGVPVSGNPQQFHTVTIGVVDVDAKTSPGTTTIISGATDQHVASFNFDTNASEGVSVKSVTFTNNGTVNNDEVSNFVLKYGATVVASNPGTFGTDGKVTVDFATPWFIDKSKSYDMDVYVTIKGGITVSKTLIVQIAESKHLTVVGDNSKAQIVVTIDNETAFTAQSSQSMTIGQGTLTVARNTATLPVSATLIDGVAKNKLAAYKFTAGSTEGVRVTRLRLTASGTGVAAADLSNFTLYKYDETTGVETQMGDSQSMSGTTITFENTSDGLFDVAAGKNVIIHAYADVNTAAAWTGTAMHLFIGTTNSNLLVKAKGLNSGDFVPAASITLSSVDSEYGNNVLFANGNSGALVISLDNSSPAATSVAKGTSNVDFTHYRLYATSEDVSVTQLIVRAYNMTGTVSTASTTNEFINVRLYDATDAANPVQLGTAVATPTSGVSTFSFTLKVPKDSYKILKVVADIPTASDSVADVLHFDVPGAGTIANDITSTGAYSGIDIEETGSATGRTMTLVSPTVTVTWASGVTNNVVTNATAQTLGVLQLTAGQYEDVKVSSIKIYAGDETPLGNGDPASSADTDLTNFKLVGEDGTQYGVTKNLTSGTPDYATFDAITNLTVAKGQTKTIYVQANIAGTSGTYYVGSTSTADFTGVGAVSGNSATVSGTGTGKANAIQSVATLTFALDASNPNTRLVGVGASNSGNTEVTLLAVSADAQYEDVDVTKFVVQGIGASGDSVQNSFKESGLKLYHKVGSAAERLVGNASFVSSTDSGLAGNYTATFIMAAGSLRLSKTTDDVLIVKGIFRGTEDGLTTASSPVIRLGNGTAADDSLFIEARGVSSGTALDDSQFNSTNGVSLSSNQVVAYKAYPTFSYADVGGTLVNGVEQPIFSFKAKANEGPVALKQLKLTTDIVDNVGTYDSSMQVVSFKLFRGTTDITANVRIAESRGKSLEGGSNAFATVTGTGKAFYITWETTGEELIPSGTEYTYVIKATPSGFNTDADNDYIRVRLDNDDTATELSQANATYYISTVTSTTAVEAAYLLSLQDSTFDGNTLAATSTTSLLWSDRSAAGHSAATGTFRGGTASSTGDWFNGYFVNDTPTNYSLLVR